MAFIHTSFGIDVDAVIHIQSSMITRILHSKAINMEEQKVYFSLMPDIVREDLDDYALNQNEREYAMYMLGVFTEGIKNYMFWMNAYKDAYDPDPVNTLINMNRMCREDYADQSQTTQSN